MKKIQRKLKALKLSLPRKGKNSRLDIVVNLHPELLVYIVNWVKHMPNNRAADADAALEYDLRCCERNLSVLHFKIQESNFIDTFFRVRL